MNTQGAEGPISLPISDLVPFLFYCLELIWQNSALVNAMQNLGAYNHTTLTLGCSLAPDTLLCIWILSSLKSTPQLILPSCVSPPPPFTGNSEVRESSCIRIDVVPIFFCSFISRQSLLWFGVRNF